MVRFAEPLEVDNLPFPQELDGVPHIRVVGETENVVVGHSGLLFCAQVLVQICNGVPCDGKGVGIEGGSGGCRGIHSSGVIHKVVVKSGGFDLFWRHIAGELIHNGAHHFQMPQFLGAYRSNGNVPYPEKR